MKEKDIVFVSPEHSPEDLKNAVTSKNFDKELEIFQKRIEGWYLDPAKDLAKNKNFGFPLIIILCVLIDTLSQFYYGSQKSNKNNFKNFLKLYIPNFKFRLPETINNYQDYSDIFYSGFRCGIMHEAKISHGEIEASKNMLHWRKRSHRLIVDPVKLLKQVIRIFNDYLKDLKKNESLRGKFEKKLEYYISDI